MKKIAFAIVFAVAFLLIFASFCDANENYSQVKRVDRFICVLDSSGSMMMKDNMKNLKLDLGKDAILTILKNIPLHLEYNAAFVSMSPNSIFYNDILNDEDFANSVKSVKSTNEIFGRMSPLNKSLQELEPILVAESRKTAVILITDGDFNIGDSPVETIRRIYKENPKISFHIVSLADTKNGKNTISEIKNISDSFVLMDVNEIVFNNKGKEFASETLFADVDVVPVYFGFDNYTLSNKDKENIISNIENVQTKYLVDKVFADGWTDFIGTDEYNLDLSYNRGKSVINYIFEKMEDKINSFGYAGNGKSYKYDNKTKDGRRLNRRVDIILE